MKGIAAKLDVEEALFAVKCFVAAMLAFYVALSIGLTRPYWAVTTSYIVAQPLAGAVLSKAVFRVIGTVLGATAAVVLVPALVDEPAALAAALALWLGFCLYWALLDRTPRAYVFLLAGYTASIIGFPSVERPAAIFTVAALRVQEITIGILAGSLIHGAVLPRTVTAQLLARVATILTDAERWTREALGRSPRASGAPEQRRIAVDLAVLDELGVQLPFDTARILPRSRTLYALQDRLLEVLPLGASVEDRLVELDRSGGVPADIAAIVADAADWLQASAMETDGAPEALLDRLTAIGAATGTKSWRDMLILNLCARLGDLLIAHADARALGEQLRSPSSRAVSPRVRPLIAHAAGRSLHRDPGQALRAALCAITCVGVGCAFWIATGWPEGAGAVLIAGVCCALFGNVDRPGPVIVQFLIGSAGGLAMAMLYAFALLPGITAFETMAAVMAPPLLLMGSMMARPRTRLRALGALLGFANTVGFNATYTADFESFVNGAVAQLSGTALAVVAVGLFHTIGIERSVGRLFRAGWRDVARRVEGRDGDERRWGSRMLDRIGLLLPRLAAREAPPAALLDALTDLRTGLVAGRLRAAAATPPERAAVVATLAGIGRHYRALRPSRPVPPPAALLDQIDAGLALYAADPEPARGRAGLIHLTSLRRNLFPAAPAFGEVAA